MSDVSVTRPAPRDPSGVWAWALGFGFVLFPVVGSMAAGFAQYVAYRAWYAKRDDLSTVNARNAANWGLTYAILTPVCFLVFLLAGSFSHIAPLPLLLLGGIFFMALLVASLVNLIFSIAGIVQATRGNSFDTALSFRFVKGERVWTPAD